MMKLKEAGTIREALHNLVRWQNQTVVMAPVPVGAKTIRPVDLELFAEDFRLLLQVGITVCFAATPHDQQYRAALKTIPCGQFEIPTLEAVVDKALEVGASKICFLCGVDRIHTKQHGDLDSLSVFEAGRIIAEEPGLSDEVGELLQLAINACQRGISRIHLVNVHHPGTLLEELFTGHGAGVMVYNGESAPYKKVCPATTQNAVAISQLISQSHPAWQETNLEFVRQHIAEFLVFAVDDEVFGCVRVLRKKDEELELHGFSYAGGRFSISEILEGLLQSALERAQQEGLRNVIVPASELPPLMAMMPWFAHLGFQKGKPAVGGSGKQAWVKRLP